MNSLQGIAVKLLRKAANDIEIGNSELSDAEAMDLLSAATHQVMSKETACQYLNLSRCRFDDLVRARKLPRGKKRIGFKELVWWRDELDASVKAMKNNKK